MVSVIEGLCKGHGCLEQPEFEKLLETMKHAKHPASDESSKILNLSEKFYGRFSQDSLVNTRRSIIRY